MAVIGIDSHKDTLACCAVDASGSETETRSIANTAAGHAELVAWAGAVGVERVGIEGTGNYGRPAAEALIASGAEVVEVPPQMTTAARRGRRTRTKTDPVDALEIARIAARDNDLPPPRFAGGDDDLAALVRYRRELVKDRTRAINRLHATLEKTRCGYHTRIGPLTTAGGLNAASRLLRGDPAPCARIACDRISDIRRLNRRITELGAQIAAAVDAAGTSLTAIYGVGPLVAADILTEVGDPARFATKDRFAAANGTAADALGYVGIVRSVLGTEWLTPDRLRLGASSLLGNVVTALAVCPRRDERRS